MYVCCCSVAQSYPTLCDPMDCSTPGFPVFHHFLELAQTHVHWVGDAIQPPRTHCPLLFLPSIFPSIRVFSSASALCIRWPQYWSLSFSISPSSEYSGLISFRIDWFDVLSAQGILESSPTPQFESINYLAQPSLCSNSLPYVTTGKAITLIICTICLYRQSNVSAF